MLEALLNAPPSQGRLIFQLGDFFSMSTIKDIGPLGIPITVGTSLTTGVDANGDYINFTGTANSVISFSNALLDSDAVEIRIKLQVTDTRTSAAYGAAVIDTRPVNTNTKTAIIFSHQVTTASPSSLYFQVFPSQKSVIYPSWYKDLPNDVSFVLNDKGSFAYLNREPIGQIADVARMIGQSYKIGKSAFSAVPGVIARIYAFEIYALD